jgi:sulfonate transport system substrate-binding protein
MNQIKIGGVPEHFNLPWRLAIEEGHFAFLEQKVVWEDQPLGTGQMVQKLKSGELDMAVLLTEGIIKAILEDGLEATILQVYVSSPLRWGIHVPFHSDIRSFDDLKDKTFAISRHGSGSHLMTYVKAEHEKWDLNALHFKVIGDVEACMQSLEKNETQGFLWEKYTTFPYTEKERCRYIDEVITPWPCFVLAIPRNTHPEKIDDMKRMIEVVLQLAATLKTSDDVAELIGWRYNLRLGQVKNWLVETNWNYLCHNYREEIKETVDYLVRLGLVQEQNSMDWESKLFL